MKSAETAVGARMPLWQSVVTVAALVVIVAGMKAAEAIVQPFLLALFLAVIFGAPLGWLRRRGVPRWLALTLVVVGTITCVVVATALVENSVDEFKLALPRYKQAIQAKFDAILGVPHVDRDTQPDSVAPDSVAPDSVAPDSVAPDSVAPDSVAPDSVAPDSVAPDSVAPDSVAPDSVAPAGQAAPSAGDTPPPTGWMPRLLSRLEEHGLKLDLDSLSEQFQPGKAMDFVGALLGSFQGVLANTFLILLLTVFLLAEAASFPEKLRAISQNPSATIAQSDRILGSLNQYVMMKSAISLLTAVLVTLLVTVCGVEYALLWGALAFALNFVPNIGSIIAAVPPVLLALVTNGTGTALALALGYLLVNLVIGNVVEPRFMGRGLGLSTLVVFVSLVFWGWVLGPVGMVLSVPLTMTLKIALDNHPDTRWIAILLGPASQNSGRQKGLAG